MEAVRNRVADVPAVAGATFGSTVTRPPMNPLDFDKSATVMAWLSPTGIARSLPTNIHLPPRLINANGLRSVRKTSFPDPLPEGGRSFAVGVNVDNYVEERWDHSHKSGTVPAILRCKSMYKSEYMDRTNEACGTYRTQLAEQGLIAKVPAKGQEYRNSKRIGYNTNYISYAQEGFGRGASKPHADATIPRKQGSAWVGTAAVRMYDSLTKTQQAREDVEFQKIHPSADGKMKAVITCTRDGKPAPSAVLAKTMATAKLSEGHGAHWQSMYSTEICKLPRR